MKWLLVLTAVAAVASQAEGATAAIPLDRGWRIQSSAKVPDTGATISASTFKPVGWYPATMPSTVLAALVANKIYPDPYFAMNLRSIPGTSYPIGRNFSTLAMPDDSPFRVPWWFRTEFTVPATLGGQRIAIHFDGINYRANIWLNGRRIATSTEVAGTYRRYEFDITDAARIGGANVLAVEISPPQPDDLAWTWVDWNPMPPDKNMGVWRPVSVTASGEVTIRDPHVVSKVSPSLDRADLTISADLRNLSARPVRATVRGLFSPSRTGPSAITLTRVVELAANEARTVIFTPDDTPALRLLNPDLWWPADMGSPWIIVLGLNVQVAEATSDTASIIFGIREITSTVSADGRRQFFINGKPILIRGGGWAPDMLLRPDADRQRAEFDYVRELHLNTIRLEGKIEDDAFFARADQHGILVLAGWCCCDQWEQWAKWKPENRAIAEASQHDQVRRLRAHPSLLAWLNGSDNPPPAEIEKMYVDVLAAERWPNPYVSSASQKATSLTGPSGVKMTGPYDWVPPAYWLLDTRNGGAYGFNTETSPGAAVPPIESLKQMLPADHLWPIDDVWNYHAGGGQFRTLTSFTSALEARYGPAASIDDYAMKAQFMTYEGERAMFEAYARNTPSSTGVIQWMLNNAWPGMIWHLYDYYLRPGGGYFGTKKANEPWHVQYSYDDRSIVAVNTTTSPLLNVRVSVRVFNLDMTEKFADTKTLSVPALGHERVLVLPDIADLSAVYFIDLRMTGGATTSTNFYWLGTKMDVLDFTKATWYTTPVTSYADFTALKDLPATTVTSSLARTALDATGERMIFTTTLHNTGTSVALFVRLKLTRGAGGDEILPVLWSDNYISLLPGETRDITVTINPRDLRGATAALAVTGWNIR